MRKKRSVIAFFVFLFSLLALLLVVFFIPPDQPLPFLRSPLSSIPFFTGNTGISPLVLFSLLFFLSLSSLATFLLRSSIHGIVFGLYGVSLLLFRYVHLRSGYYVLLLTALLITVLFLLRKAK